MVNVFCSSRACTIDVRKSWSWISLDKLWQHSSSWTFTASWFQVRQHHITDRVTKRHQHQTQRVSNLTWPMSLMHDFIKDSLWKNNNKKVALLIWQWWCILFDISQFTASVCQVWTFAFFTAAQYLRKKDSGGKVLVVKERNRSNIFHQVSFLCLQIHKTCGGQLFLWTIDLCGLSNNLIWNGWRKHIQHPCFLQKYSKLYIFLLVSSKKANL